MFIPQKKIPAFAGHSFSKGMILLLLFLTAGGISHSFAQSGKERQLADQYLSNSEFAKAAELYDKLFDKDPFGTYPNYFRCLLAMKSFDKAEKLVRKISKKQPDNLSYGADLGFVYQSQGQDEKAQQQYERTIKMLRPDQGLILSLANAFIIRQDWDHALATYLEGKRLVKEEYGFHFELADVYYQKGDFTGMINEYLDAVAENPMVQQQVLNILQSRVGYDPENNKGDLLRTSLLRRIQKNPDQPIFSEMLIWLFVQQKDFDSAFLQAKALDKRMKEDGSRVLSLGNLAASNFNYDAAIKCYQYVVDKGTMNSNYIPARMELLNTYNKKITEENNYTSADLLKLEKDYETTLAELGRTARTASLVRGLAHLRAFYLDRADSAMADLEQTIDFNGISRQTQAECKLELGDILLFQGNVWDSDLLYAQVDKDFKHDPLGQDAKFRSARLDYFRGDFMWAQAQLDVLKSATSQLIANDALSLSLLIQDNMGLDSTTDALMLYSKADLLSYRNKNDLALAILDTLLIKFPDHSLTDEVWYKAARIMDSKHNWQAEDSLYQKIVEKFGEDVLADDALFHRAELYENKLKDPAKAMELYQDLLTKYPGSLFVVEARKRFRALRGDVLN
ncbi:MAG: tetratricopeptide repeat protein [Bacteroidetes bacterium]|nr:tetratricopeptide repeat protein [Bacteroidota bacterium]MBK9541258.1 tetratricopeptide repeat protein [Bacteroidota bacterium]